MVATCDESETSFQFPFTITANNMIKISGLISEDRTLTADHVYYVNDHVGIMEGVTLTIEPGTRLEFAKDKRLTSFGKLKAKGTPEKPIVFTSHDGNAAWRGVASHDDFGQSDYIVNTIYTNADSTLFTLLPTEQTPNTYEFNDSRRIRVNRNNWQTFYICDYLQDYMNDNDLDLDVDTNGNWTNNE